MILSDRSIREALSSGRIVIDPLMDGGVQPSSVDVRVDRYFRVFRNDTTPFIDPKEPQEDLTELVEVADGQAFILHPGEFVLGSTLERVRLPDDIVGRLEGKSGLGRLGLLIHSSLPASEEVFVLDEKGQLGPRPIGDVVSKRLRCFATSFDPDTFQIGFAEVTGWFEGPADRIFEVELVSGRTVRVTAGHNLFTIDRASNLTRVRTCALARGTRVAVPRRLPGPGGVVAWRGGRRGRRAATPVDGELAVDRELAWRLGGQVARSTLAARVPGRPSARDGWEGEWDGARVPPGVFGWSGVHIESFLDGMVDGDGSREETRTSICTTSKELAGDVLLLAARIGRQGGSCRYEHEGRALWRVAVSHRCRVDVWHRDHEFVGGDLAWDEVVAVHDTGSVEPVYDLEVRPGGRKVENFLAGSGGVFVSNTAGFVDAGWDGHLTLELSNVSNLPIALYPGMKIGQISFLQMSTPAEHPYGSDAAGSKYQGQRGPTPSRYYLNFRPK